MVHRGRVSELDGSPVATPVSADSYRAVFQCATDAMLLADDSGRYLDANSAACELLGYSRDELLSMSVKDLAAEEAKPNTERHFELFLEDQRQKGTYKLRTKSGQLLAIEYSAIANVQPGVHLAVLKDLSEVTPPHQERSPTERDLRLITDDLPALVSYIDKAFCYRFANAAYEDWFGIPRDQIVGRPIPEVIGVEAFENVRPMIEQALAGERVVYERLMPYIHSRPRVTRTELVPDLSDSGEVLGFVAHISDVTEIRRAQETSRRSLERFHAAASSSFDAMFVFEAIRNQEGKVTDFLFVEVNAQGEKLLGFTREQLLGHGMCELLPQNREMGFFDKYVKVLETGEPCQEEFGECAAGHVDAWFHQTVVPLEDGIAITVRDMTEHRRSVEALQQSENRLRLAMEAGQMGTWEWNVEANEVIWSPELQRMHGLDPGDFGGTFEDFLNDIHPEDRERVMKVLEHTFQSEEHRVHYRLALKDGTIKWVEGRGKVYRNEAGTPVRLAGVCLDVTERVGAELDRERLIQELDSERTKLRQIFEKAPALIAVLRGNDHVFEVVNDPFEQFLQASALAGQRLADALPELSQQGFVQLLDSVLESGQPYRGYDVPITVGDQEKFLDLVYQPLLNSDGSPMAVLLHGVDVTEKVQARRQIEQLNRSLELRVQARTAELEAANREMEGFTYSVSHDLRAPLRAINSTSRIVLEDYSEQLAAPAKDLLEKQAEASSRMGSLIDDLLRLSRLSRQEMSPQKIDMTKLACELVEEMEAAAASRGVHIIVEPKMHAVADPRLIQFVYQNLLENAIKFSPAGGEVRVGHRGEAFYVSDQGIGFNMKYADKLFRPFERLVLDSEFPGTGIGLANVRRIVERHKGKVWAEGEEGKGATFYFTLFTEAS